MAEEWVLMCRLLLKKPTWVNINEPLIYYRVHEVQKLKTLNRTMLESEYLARLEVYRMLREHRFFTPAVHAFYSKVMIRLIRKSIQIRSVITSYSIHYTKLYDEDLPLGDLVCATISEWNRWKD